MVLPLGGNLRKLNAGAQLQTFPYPTVSKSFLFSNAFMPKSCAQTLNVQTHGDNAYYTILYRYQHTSTPVRVGLGQSLSEWFLQTGTVTHISSSVVVTVSDLDRPGESTTGSSQYCCKCGGQTAARSRARTERC